jgi:poly(hydroxyalkanoate) granule-associated protein
MATNCNTHEENIHDKRQRPLFHSARKVLLASIGAMSLAHDEIDEFAHKLVERGEIAEKDGRDLVREMRELRSTRMHAAEDRIHKRIGAMLDRMNIPTQKDIQELNDKITVLTQQVEELMKSKV